MNSSNCELKVIGAGWGRTGTTSLKRALEILGQGPCYHMAEMFLNKNDDINFWLKVAEGKNYDLDDVFNGEIKFKSSCDYPSAKFWKEQLIRYPNAKVILSIRDPEKWYASCSETIFQEIPGYPEMKFGIRVALAFGYPLPNFNKLLYQITTKDSFHNDFSKQNILKCFTERNNSVIKECPPDKLLVYEVSQGWEPLCKFLDVPIPNEPFPHMNDTEIFKKHLDELNTQGWRVIACIAGIGIAGLAYFGLKNKV